MATVTIELTCPECGYEVDPAEFNDEAGMCNSCWSEDFLQCAECGEVARYADCSYGVCPVCLHTCPECDCEVVPSHWYDNPGCCTECYYELYEECHRCSMVFERNDCGDELCPDCRANRWDNMAHAKAPTGASWEEWAEFAEFTRTVDFGCKFDCEGECSGTREGDWSGSNGRGCCRDCARNHGYLDRLPEHAVEEVSNLYDDSKGFWRPGGCVLPAEYRGIVCLTYRCGAKGRKRSDDPAGMELIQLHSKVINRNGCETEAEKQLQTEQWKKALEADRVAKATKVTKAAFQEQMLQAGYFSELGMELPSIYVEQLMQRA